MKMSNFSTKRTSIGILLIILAIVLGLLWEFYARDKVMYDEVLVLKADTDKGTIITQDMLDTEYVDLRGREVLKVKDYKNLLGKEVVQKVKGGEVLYSEYFDESDLTASSKRESFVLSIPNEWIETYPQTLRRGDEAYFYVDGKLLTSAKVAYVKNSSNKEVKSTDEERLDGSATVSLIEVIVNKEQAALISEVVSKNIKLIVLYN